MEDAELSASDSVQQAQHSESQQASALTGLSVFERAYGRISQGPATSSLESKPWPLPPAAAPARPQGSIGPVDPPYTGLSRQMENMMLAVGTYEGELAVRRRMYHGQALVEGSKVVGPLGRVQPLGPVPPRKV
eukprot:CAMPEP_0202919486 /NCGR_PEP_ID=MMETSP1392-20130828/75968_1 /ASSEMBLY_ACC=CAM_ASM_000868 /TAXON_ID=225041 /ORGANISM="Chlamydomonas chlamydogama, Strain SAG 11-48b" /LENGTH=132 /DNA_ID=CAMNT_0049612871 /DNA_START=315 /DNA_END=713 /DNA_ORIENTATION=-